MLVLKSLASRDHKKAIDFAIEGMNFAEYISGRFIRQLYGRYFFYQELESATRVYAAYEGDRLLGVLMLKMKSDSKQQSNFWRRAYVRFFNWLMGLFGGGTDSYSAANSAMYRDYVKHEHPDGELNFFAVDPTSQGKGVGSFLLTEASKGLGGKEIYLYTDSFCAYQFYDHREFERVAQKPITVEVRSRKVDMTVFLYHRYFAG